MPSSTSRNLTYLTAALFALMGSALFLALGRAAADFPWQGLPFVAMMDTWCLGSAGVALLAYGWFMSRRSGATILEGKGYTS